MPNQLTPVQDYLYHETESQSNQSVNNNTNNVTPPVKAPTKNQKDHITLGNLILPRNSANNNWFCYSTYKDEAMVNVYETMNQKGIKVQIKAHKIPILKMSLNNVYYFFYFIFIFYLPFPLSFSLV